MIALAIHVVGPLTVEHADLRIRSGMKVHYVRFDEREDAILALELVAAMSGDLKENPSHWKWVVLGMQNAMQGAMVLALAGSDGWGALGQNSQKQNRAWLQNPKCPQPKEIMADYTTLLHRVQQAELMDGPPLAIGLAEVERLQQLNKLRRTFAHFNPQGWSIELKLLLLLMPVSLSAVEHLLTTQNRVQAQLTEEQKKRIGDALAETRAALKVFDQNPAAAG